MRETVTYTVVCDSCGSEWKSEGDWLENDPCVPDNGGDTTTG